MEKFITDYVVEYFKSMTSKKKQVNNQTLDEVLQRNLGIKSFTPSGIRSLIHFIRLNIIIENEKGEKGWICGTSEGYYLSYNAVHILEHLNQFESKIRKMMLIHKKGMSMLVDKIYYKQQELKLNHEN